MILGNKSLADSLLQFRMREGVHNAHVIKSGATLAWHGSG
jgi:hypothetical protein